MGFHAGRCCIGEGFVRYGKVVKGEFASRPNRFVAKVLVDGVEETVHVKNTGRCKELLVPGVTVVLEKAENPNRKTPYDLIAVYKGSAPGGIDSVPTPTDPSLYGPEGYLFNIDSQAPNKVVGEWLAGQGYDYVKPEYTFGNSRVDFYMEKAGERYLLEVKGCTLEINGMGYFPDAPTERGVKHLNELAEAAGNGYHCMLAFVIQMEGVYEVKPNMDTHPAFGEALARAQEAGVQVVFIPCVVKPGELYAK